MRNTRKIIESIVNYTNFNPALKAALESLYENNVDIVYWNALNEAEDKALEKKIKELLNAISYLLEVHIFPKEDINLNSRTLLWPQEIGPIFEKNEEV